MKVVLDTNVLVSGMLSPEGLPATVLDATTDGHLVPCFDERILTEYRLVLSREKFAFSGNQIETMMARIMSAGYLASAEPLSAQLPDPKDRMFVEVAVACGADYIITGNLKDYPENATLGVAVVTPREFANLGRLYP